MEKYDLSMHLLGVNEYNLPPFKDARIRRFKSIKKIKELMQVAKHTRPVPVAGCFTLNLEDPEWDDLMTYPQIEYSKLIWWTNGLLMSMFAYAYNYNNYSANIRLRTLRYLFPVVNLGMFYFIYSTYATQLQKVQLFDEYVQLRANELVQQNKYLFQHEKIKRTIWWYEDFKETLFRVHRQANNHEASDFKDSELILQDFIRRYTNPNDNYPLAFGKQANIFV